MDYDTAKVADILRKVALDEKLKSQILGDPKLKLIAKRVAEKYVAGETMAEAVDRASALNKLGYTTGIDFMGESIRKEPEANAALDEFLQLVEKLKANKLKSSISLDLSHIGSTVSYELGLTNARLLAKATEEAGFEMMLSMEGIDRVDGILSIHRALSAKFEHVGITIQARPHRTNDDLIELLKLPGRIRLVKGAYDTPIESAYARDSEELRVAYDEYAELLLQSGHLCSIATHDWDRLKNAESIIKQCNVSKKTYMFEFLSGLGSEQAKILDEHGHPVQEYIVYGHEWWLYVCNRLAEQPTRLFEALLDATS